MMQFYFILKLFFLFLIISNNQSAHAISNNQEPLQDILFEDDFKSRYNSDVYNYEGEKIVTKTPSGTGNYKEYSDNDRIKTKEVNNNNSLSINLGPFSWLFYLLLAAAIAYLAYILINDGGSGLFSSRQHKKIENYESISAENIEHTNIKSLIKEAENEGDYRLAIRYYYLLVLKTLSVQDFIKYEDDKTNAEYLNEVNEKHFSPQFKYTSYLYNYIWYGKFPVNNKKYDNAKNNFVSLLNSIK